MLLHEGVGGLAVVLPLFSWGGGVMVCLMEGGEGGVVGENLSETGFEGIDEVVYPETRFSLRGYECVSEE
jgi:hypothetical protein